ncbi:Alpha/Beta hydrolase protein [Mycena rosella]|uniref:Alpha/Beta hydrolase protein n=1 Tax=Mycena rosella TaxID=1033263 RepID=A0AAD7GI41_MYCRO|nr:Alpha/Beta hydrolase protein [Mycena rosella]
MTLNSLQTTLIYFLFSVRAASSESIYAPVVDLGYAQYQGVFDADLNITSFLGMRYAAAPTGNLRWRAPSPPSAAGGVQLASSDPPPCHQGAFGASPTNPMLVTRAAAETEDCLFLSVYTPALNSTKPLPTIVWIHGGGYVLGGATGFNGVQLLQEANNEAVVVIIQHRLGLFGFLAGQQVKDGGALNVGLLDQDFAFRWVNKNAERALSGNPDHVTIWGQSAGAGAVIQHVVANNGKTQPQLFKAAITSSTFLPSQYKYNDRIPQTLFNEVAAQARCTDSDANALECLRAVDSASLETINLNILLAGFSQTFAFGPVVDGSFITQSPTELLAQGKTNGEILLSMTNSNEGPLFINQTVDYTNVAHYVRELFPLFGDTESAAVASVYESLGPPLEQVDLIMGESIFVCPTYNLLRAFPGASYKGEYAVTPGMHTNDLFYYFSLIILPGYVPFNNTDFRTAFNQGFFSFAAHLDPNDKLVPSITPAWPKWSAAQVEMVFNKTEDDVPMIAAAPTSQALLDRCE